jgi:transcriptional regulator with XRE-family HTH domain
MNQSQVIGRIRKIRASKDYTQEYMAMKLGISQKAYSKLERQETQLKWEKLIQIANILEVDISKLMHPATREKISAKQEAKISAAELDLWKTLMAQYEERISQLNAEIAFLRSLIRTSEV